MKFVSTHAVRLYGLLSALLLVAAHYQLDLPAEAILAAGAALLGLGEAAQRSEDKKTAEAYLA
jgi:hypothetical protein